MLRISRMLRAVAVPLALSSLAMSTSCGPSVGSICEEREACLGGNDKDVEACEAGFSTGDTIASDIGCGSEFDEYFSCFEDSASCFDASLGGGCASDEDCTNQGLVDGECSNGMCVGKRYDIEDEDTCKTEREAYQECLDF